MLSRFHSFIALALVGAASIYTGCVIETVDGTGTTNNITNTSSNSSSTSGGQGGAGGTTTNTGGAGGAGGAAVVCTKPDGTGLDAKACDNMDIAPASGASPICDENGGITGMNPSPGYSACVQGFAIFNGGPAEDFQGCLAKLPATPAEYCALDVAQKCIDETFKAACEVPAIRTYCQDIEKACVGFNDMSFVVDACAYQLSPFNAETVKKYEQCFNTALMDPTVTCDKAHDDCWAARF